MIYMNTFEDLADKVRSAADCSDAARIIEDFVTEYGCSIAEKNELNIANVSGSLTLDAVNRCEVIDEKGRSYVNWNEKNKVELLFQDKGRTLKVFIKRQ